MAVTSRVPTMKGKKPKLPLSGCHELEKRRWVMVVLARIGFALKRSVTATTKAIALMEIRESRIDAVAKLSLRRRIFTGKTDLLLTFQVSSGIP
jgi:hypothetical protein